VKKKERKGILIGLVLAAIVLITLGIYATSTGAVETTNLGVYAIAIILVATALQTTIDDLFYFQ
jgi:hypothetical protein